MAYWAPVRVLVRATELVAADQMALILAGSANATTSHPRHGQIAIVGKGDIRTESYGSVRLRGIVER
jgi:hypothetical protein